MRWLMGMIAVVAGMAGGNALAAERALDLLDAQVSYSADFTVSSSKGRYSGKVWHQPGRERRDVETKDGGQTVIIRRDLDGAWLLKPSGRWYVGLGLAAVGQLAGGIDQLTVERTKIGESWEAGHRATRYRVAGKGPQGQRYQGEAWFTREGILVKAEGALVDDKGLSSPVQTELNHLKIGRVDDSTFALPKGWFGMDLRKVPADGILQAIESLKPLLERR